MNSTLNFITLLFASIHGTAQSWNNALVNRNVQEEYTKNQHYNITNSKLDLIIPLVLYCVQTSLSPLLLSNLFIFGTQHSTSLFSSKLKRAQEVIQRSSIHTCSHVLSLCQPNWLVRKGNVCNQGQKNKATKSLL